MVKDIIDEQAVQGVFAIETRELDKHFTDDTRDILGRIVRDKINKDIMGEIDG